MKIAPIRRNGGLGIALAALLLLGGTDARAAHEIPSDVTVQAFVRPEGRTLRFLVRAPLEAMRDFEFPLRGREYLDLPEARPLLRQAAEQWIADYVDFYEDGESLGDARTVAARISLPSDPSFRDYSTAEEHLTGRRLPPDTELPWRQAMLDVLFEYDIRADTSDFSIDPRFAHLGLRTLTVLRFLPPDGSERPFQYTGNPGVVRLDPRWHQAAWRFVVLGFDHILDGLDHLLFLLCLVIPFRRFWDLVPIVTSFTVAHSITLIASASGIAPEALWFPPLVETLIAASIVYMALENIFGAHLGRRWPVAFAFGLVHGFGFSFVLGETLQFAGSHLLTSLLAFNVGVEFGQLFVLLLTIPVLELFFRKAVPERMGVIVLSALLAHTSWHWMTDRGSALLQYDFTAPALDLAFFADLLRWLMLLLIATGAVWTLRSAYAWLGGRTRLPEAAAGAEG